MFNPTSGNSGMWLDFGVGVMTDVSFSGAWRGAAIGHISPEASSGGLIAYVKEGDKIHIDINNYALNLLVSDEEIAQRKATMKLKDPRPLMGYLKRYASMVCSADKGAVYVDS